MPARKDDSNAGIRDASTDGDKFIILAAQYLRHRLVETRDDYRQYIRANHTVVLTLGRRSNTSVQ